MKQIDGLPEQRRVNLGRCANLKGKVFGRLRVKRAWSKSKSGVMWLCACRCGGWTIVRAEKLKAGNTQSCGCLANEFAEGLIKRTRRRQQAMMRLIGKGQ